MYIGHRVPRARKTFLTLLLVWSFMPGGAELVEQTVHFVSTGHFAHTIPGDPDEPPRGAEHDCQGLLHFCHCSHGAGQVGPEQQATWAPQSGRLATAGILSTQPEDPPARGVFHPPKRVSAVA